jgi:hypothetical protein
MNNGTKKMLLFHFHQYCHKGREAEIIFWEVRQDGSVSFLHQPLPSPLSHSLSLCTCLLSSRFSPFYSTNLFHNSFYTLNRD